MSKKKLLMISDAAVVPTGFGRVSEALLDRLHASGRWDIKQLGINYFDDDHDKPYRIFSATGGGNMTDWLGYSRVNKIYQQVQPDVTLILQDYWHIAEYIARLENPSAIVSYFPVDSPNIKYDWAITHAAASEVCAYTRFGAEEFARSMQQVWEEVSRSALAEGKKNIKNINLSIHKDNILSLSAKRVKELTDPNNIRIIPHGLDATKFHPTDKIKARRSLNLPENGFIVGNVNRNQPRKRLDITIRAFSMFAEDKPDALLVLHDPLKTPEGWDLAQLAYYYGVKDKVMISNATYEISLLNELYNSLDVMVNSSGGEGWGLCLGPNSLVSVKGGVRRIADIVPGDLVADQNGKFQKVKATTKRKVKDYYRVKVSGREEIFVTKEHPFLTKDGWKNVQDLQEQEFVAVGTIKDKTIDSHTYDMKDHLPEGWKCDDSKVWQDLGSSPFFKDSIPTVTDKFDVTKNQTEEPGKAFQGESDKASSTAVLEVVSVLKEGEITLSPPKIYPRYLKLTPSLSYLMGCYTAKSFTNLSEAVDRLFSSTCGDLAGNKRVPKEVFESKDPSIIKGFLTGLFLGDDNSSFTEQRLTTTSREMAHQVQLLLDYLGLWSSLTHSHKFDTYQVSIDTHDINTLLYDNSKTFRQIVTPEGEHNWSRISHIEKVEKDLEVYDISVENTHSFIANGVIVHNTTMESAGCGVAQIVPDWSATKEIWEGLAYLTDIQTIRHETGRINTAQCVVDADDLADQLQMLYDNPDDVIQVGEDCYQEVQKDKYKWDNIVDQMEKVLLSAIENPVSDEESVELEP